jgi:hypothetical protein
MTPMEASTFRAQGYPSPRLGCWRQRPVAAISHRALYTQGRACSDHCRSAYFPFIGNGVRATSTLICQRLYCPFQELKSSSCVISTSGRDLSVADHWSSIEISLFVRNDTIVEHKFSERSRSSGRLRRRFSLHLCPWLTAGFSLRTYAPSHADCNQIIASGSSPQLPAYPVRSPDRTR